MSSVCADVEAELCLLRLLLLLSPDSTPISLCPACQSPLPSKVFNLQSSVKQGAF